MNQYMKHNLTLNAAYNYFKNIGRLNDKEGGLIKFSCTERFCVYEISNKIMIGTNDIVNYYPIAELTIDFKIKGLLGNSGTDRFERLSPVEKIEIQTLINTLKTDYIYSTFSGIPNFSDT